MLKDRLKSGSILLIFALCAFFISGTIGNTIFAFIGAFMFINGLKEYFVFSNAIGVKGFPMLTGIFASLLAIAGTTCANNISYLAVMTLITIIFIISGFITVFRRNNFAVDLQNFFSSVFGYFYIGWSLTFIAKLFYTESLGTSGRMLVLFLILVTKFSDIGAYFVGSACSKRPQGNHKMFPKLSPKKSWEGFFGGMIVSSIVAVLIAIFFGKELTFYGQKVITIPSAIVLAVIFTTFGFIGDIAESSFKRAGKLDDSGSILPGLGGAMDVLDSLIPNAPMFYAYLILATA